MENAVFALLLAAAVGAAYHYQQAMDNQRAANRETRGRGLASVVETVPEPADNVS
jgi:hypothetical protein